MSDTHSETLQLLEECRAEIRSLKRDLYGDTNIKQKGVFDRLEMLEERLSTLKFQYEKEKLAEGTLGKMQEELNQVKLDYRVAIVYLKGIAGAVATISVTIIVAAVIGLLRILAGS